MMHTTRYEIGQTYPLEYTSGITGEKLAAPVWHVLTVAPQRDSAVKERLRKAGVLGVYPSEDRDTFKAGKKHTRKHPIVGGFIYAKFKNEPRWHVMKAERRLITGVFSDRYGFPIAVPRDVIKIVMGLETTAERLERLRREALMIREGDRAIFVKGPLTGQPVVCTGGDGDSILYQISGTSIKGKANPDMLEKVA